MNATVLLGLAAFLCLLAFLHPYVFYPLSLRLLPARPVPADPARPLPSATGVFAAFNEAGSLDAKLDNLRAIRALHPGIEFLAYSDMSTDATLAMLEAASDVVRVIPATERTGKATGMRIMVGQAHGDICIFTDANVILDPASVAPLLRHFSDPSVGGVAGSLHYINESESTTARVGGLYWRLEEHIKRLESRCGSIMGADGSIFATRRALYPVVPAHLLDDMTVSMSVLFAGKRLIHATDVVAYERNATVSRDEFRRKRRIACRAYNTHRHLRDQVARFAWIDRYKYASHKLMRWFGLVPLTLTGLFAVAALVSAGWSGTALLLVVLAGAFYLLGRMGVPVLDAGVEMLRSIIATFVGIVDAWRGRTYQTWAPAASR